MNAAENAAAEIELLRAEIEQLQYELGERDALLAAPVTPHGSEAAPDDAMVNQLVERLEQLLDELEQSDERVGALEELLRAADEANRAEQEERRQIEAWVSDIEVRIGEREKDWNAETEALRRRLEATCQERDQLIDQLRDAPGESAEDDTDTANLQALRAENTQLTRRLDEAQQELARLTRQLEEQRPLLARSTETDAELRAERLELAQQRAELTRQRAELASQRAELERLPRRQENEIDGRVRMFREHLREIHNEEQRQRSHQTMATRIAQLWKRLEVRG